MDRYPNQAAASNNAMQQTDRPATEMEALGGNLADTAMRLQGIVNMLQERIDHFTHAAQPLGNPNKDAAQPAPLLGTIGCIKFYHDTINAQVERLQGVASSLRTIL